MNISYSKPCKFCGGQIQLQRTTAGRWVPMEGPDHAHVCRRPPNQNRRAIRSSTPSNTARASNPLRPRRKTVDKGNSFPKEFVSKSAVGLQTEVRKKPRSPRRSSKFSQSRENRGLKKRSLTKKKALPDKTRRDAERLPTGRLLMSALFFLLVLLSIWSRWNEQ